jgi:hypothetical protein
MRKVRKVIAVLLLVVMSTSIGNTAFAAEEKERGNALQLLENDLYILQISNGYMKGYSLDNGNAVFEQYENGILISRCVTDYENNKVIDMDYTKKETEIINLDKETASKANRARAVTTNKKYTRLGRIRYDYTSPIDAGVCGAYVDYYKTTGSKKYDINGKYRDAASLAATIAGVLSLPVSSSMAIAGQVLSYFGLAASVGTLLIPHYYLQSTYEEIEYKLTDINLGSHSNKFFGTKNRITESGAHINEVYEEETYYSLSEWKTDDFATEVYNSLFTYSAWRIKGWD